MRKFFMSIMVALVIAIAGYAVFRVLEREDKPMPETCFDAIPADAGLIIDVRDFNAFYSAITENPLWMQLCRIASLGKLNEELSLWKRLSGFDERLQKRIVFSAHPVGKSDMRTLGFVPMPSRKEADDLVNLLKQRLDGLVTFTTRSYDKVTVNEASFTRPDSTADKILFAATDGFIVFSRSTILLEAGIRESTSPANIAGNSKFNDLVKTAGKSAAANLYVNYAQLPRAVQTLFKPEQMKKVAPVVNMADWTALDINMKKDMLIFNGLTASDSHSDKWLATLKPQQPVPVSLTDAMPPTTYAFFWMGLPQLSRYLTDYSDYLDRNKSAAYHRAQTALKSTFGIDLPSAFAEQFEGELARVFANLGEPAQSEAPFTLFRIKSTSATIEMIESWQQAVAQTGEKTERTTVTFDDKLSFTAYQLPFDVPGILFDDLFRDSLQWCAVVDNYLLFGASPGHLKRYLHYTALHSSLQTDIEYGKLSNDLSSRCNMMFYCDPARSASFFKRLFNTDTYRQLEAVGDMLLQIRASVFQLSVSGEMWYNNIFIKLNTAEAADASSSLQTSWESMLETAVDFKPQLLTNHNTGETEIFVQDRAGTIYLINNIGNILWKTSLTEAILSPVYQVDLYKNGKLQMLFNTESRIYAIDRLGNMVAGFPIALPAPAVGAVSVFDYENRRDYRFAVACANRKVCMYDGKGKSVTGWTFDKSEHPVQTDIYHFRSENKDYIAFADKYRLYILDRQGRLRVKPEANFAVGRNTVIALDRHALVLADTAGVPHFVSLADGSIRTVEAGKYSPEHYFDFIDIDGDNRPDFVFADKNKISVRNQTGKQLLEIETTETPAFRPTFYTFAARDVRIGVVAQRKNRIYLYNNAGKLLPEFPLTGSTPFSIGRLDRKAKTFNLLVGSSNNMLYNYTVK